VIGEPGEVGTYTLGGTTLVERRNVQYSISVMDSSAFISTPTLQHEWERLSKNNASVNAIFQSPAWWRYNLAAPSATKNLLAVARTTDGTLAAVVPIQILDYPLRFHFGVRLLGRMRVRAVKISSGYPSEHGDEGLYVQLVRNLLDAFPECDCILMDSMEVGGRGWEIIHASSDLRKHVHPYIPYGIDRCHLITMQGTFEQYLAKFKSKTRSNLRRTIKKLQEHGNGKLELLRIEQESEVSLFLEKAAPISLQDRTARNVSWHLEDSAAESARLALLARAGNLRCYLLRCGGDVCAFVRGYQYNGVYYYNRIGFDARFTDYSPGTALLYLLIEDLFNHAPPRLLNFHSGNWSYKAQFATDHFDEANVLLVRSRLISRLRVGRHAVFVRSVERLKRLLKFRATRQ
jgi:CelD/BcsL family acetyltransferase involved in cellulose biosynthesis